MSGQVADLVVGLSRFKRDQMLIAGLVDGQLRLWSGALGDWVVLPIGAATPFSVVAHDVEGERQAREIIRAFVGPGIATLTGSQAPASDAEGAAHRLGRASRPGSRGAPRPTAGPPAGPGVADRDPLLHRPGRGGAPDRSRESPPRPPAGAGPRRQPHVPGPARRAARDGSLSRENLRFLQVELLARFERWPELVSLPYIAEMEKVRRPRRVSELMLEALWHREILRSGRPPAEAFHTRELAGRHRALLGSVDVPRLPGALALCYLSALADGEEARLARLLASVPADRDYLESLNWAREPTPEPLGDPVQEARRLLDRHQYAAVVDLFLEGRGSELADLAVESVLELGDLRVAGQVLAVVRGFPGESFRPSRRLSRDLAELEVTVSGACSSWTEWIERVGGEARWGEASAVARQNASDWPPRPSPRP